MKIAVCLILTLLLGACAPGSGNGNAPGKPAPGPGPRPGPKTEPWWGMLTCQQRETCHDPVLNQSLIKLMYFFGRKRGPVPPGDAAPFYCGRLLGRSWSDEMGSDGLDPRVGRFLAEIFDLTACRPLPLTAGNLNNYLINHEEYKNEFH